MLNTRFNPNQTTGLIALAGTFALGTQRLLPSMQLVYGSWATIQFQKKGVIEILDLIALNDNSKYKSFKEIKALPLRKSVELKNITFGTIRILYNQNLLRPLILKTDEQLEYDILQWEDVHLGWRRRVELLLHI